MHILLFGGSGQLGTDLRAALAGHAVIAPGRDQCSIEDASTIEGFFHGRRIDWVINSAAFTSVDECESQPDVAFAVNAIGVRNIALACQEHQVPLVHISTDYVFDGRKGSLYNEEDSPNPLSAYGVSKLAGEFFVQNIAPRWLLVRTAAVFGPGAGEVPGVNFVESILRHSRSEKTLRVVDDQTTSPTFSKDLAVQIVKLMEANAQGIHHVTNQGQCTFFEFARKILEMVGRQVEVVPISSGELNRPAPRPAFSALDNARLREQGFPPLRRWEESLQEYLEKHHLSQEH